MKRTMTKNGGAGRLLLLLPACTAATYVNTTTNSALVVPLTWALPERRLTISVSLLMSKTGQWQDSVSRSPHFNTTSPRLTSPHTTSPYLTSRVQDGFREPRWSHAAYGQMFKVRRQMCLLKPPHAPRCVSQRGCPRNDSTESEGPKIREMPELRCRTSHRRTGIPPLGQGPRRHRVHDLHFPLPRIRACEHGLLRELAFLECAIRAVGQPRVHSCSAYTQHILRYHRLN